MADNDPALLAQVDQNIAAITTHVDHYVTQTAAGIRQVGYEMAVVDLHAFLRRLPTEAVTALATVAIAQLATSHDTGETP